jgi:Phage Terminase
MVRGEIPRQGSSFPGMKHPATSPEGSQAPRVVSVPEAVSSSGEEAIELAQLAGLDLDPWEAMVLDGSLGEREDGLWAAPEVGVIVPRQNGKGTILEARELAGLYLLGERLIVHSAHEFSTAAEHFRRLLGLIEGCPDLDRRVKQVRRSHGEEGITLRGGQRILFKTRSKATARGFSADLIVLDEAMFLTDAMLAALVPTMSARPNPQTWFTGSAVDQLVHDGDPFARVRERGHRGDDALAFYEWSAEGKIEDAAKIADDREAWAQANPALGVRITAAHIERERRSMDVRSFAVERLGVGDWPATAEIGYRRIPEDVWRKLRDRTSKIAGRVAFAVDTRPDRSASVIAAAGLREDGHRHVEVVDQRPGTAWVAERLVELLDRHGNVGVALDGNGPAAALLAELQREGLTVEEPPAREIARTCGTFVDLCVRNDLHHLGTTELSDAVRGAGTRQVGGDGSWVWSRRDSSTDCTPLMAATLALGLVEAKLARRSVYESRGVQFV